MMIPFGPTGEKSAEAGRSTGRIGLIDGGAGRRNQGAAQRGRVLSTVSDSLREVAHGINLLPEVSALPAPLDPVYRVGV